MRNLHLWFAAGLGVLLATFAFAILRSALAESLWLDELHTSWSVSGTWQEIASRSAAGNQTPLYFWIVAFTQQTLGHFAGSQGEWVLRLPSVIAWLAAIGLIAWHTHSKVQKSDLPTSLTLTLVENVSARRLFALCVSSWIILDRLQWFFASEARPYAMVQLFSLAGWCLVEAIVHSDDSASSKRFPTKLSRGAMIAAWCALSIANIYLHLTAILPVILQWFVGNVLVWWKLRQSHIAPKANSPSDSKPLQAGFSIARSFHARWFFAAVGVGLALLPILQLAFPVWNRRSQWASFASDVSISRATSMFPFIPVLLCVLIGCVIDRIGRDKSQPMSIATETRWVWWSAMLGPWLVAWGVTALGIAPIFHQRFVIASALPIFIVGATELMRFRHSALRWLTCAAIALAIVFSEGSVSIWREGYIVGNLRGEDWRAATQWVHDRLEPNDSLLCSSGLIEANATSGGSLSLPLDTTFAEYLSFPLLGQYRIVDSSGRFASVTPLLGDHRQWASQTEVLLKGSSKQPARVWMFYRGAPGRLKTKLAEFLTDLKMKNVVLQAAEPVRFGNVFVVELKRG